MNPKVTNKTFDCDICCNTQTLTKRNKLQQLICPNCEMICCLNCQFQYGKDDCMKCHFIFKENFIREHLGQKFIKEIVKPRIIKELMVEQEKLLPNVQPLVDWERQIRRQKREARFGIVNIPPPRPTLSKIASLTQLVFPCPWTGCRGFIKNSEECPTCCNKVCLKCHQPVQQQRHMCKIEDIQSLIAIQRETKNCPKCTANIYKTEGCDHMYCTHCLTHFSWTTGKILKNSTNGHYLNLQRYAQNVATLESIDIATQYGECTGEGYSLVDDRVDIENIKPFNFSEELIRGLYSDSNVIRYAKKLKYHQTAIIEAALQQYQDLQVSYLLNEIDYNQWSNRVYQIHKKKQHNLLYSNILSIYLSTVDYLQKKLFRQKNEVEIKLALVNLIELCNQSFDSIYQELGGNHLHIRQLSDDSDVPVLST